MSLGKPVGPHSGTGDLREATTWRAVTCGVPGPCGGNVAGATAAPAGGATRPSPRTVMMVVIAAKSPRRDEMRDMVPPSAVDARLGSAAVGHHLERPSGKPRRQGAMERSRTGQPE